MFIYTNTASIEEKYFITRVFAGTGSHTSGCIRSNKLINSNLLSANYSTSMAANS